MNFFKHMSNIFNLTSSAGEVHNTILQVIIRQLSIVDDDLDLMVLELCLSTATGKWLNEWGDWFGVYRKYNEGDKEYSARIIATIQTPKSTIPAIKQNMSNYLNSLNNQDLYTSADIEVFEPFNFIKTFSHKGEFSGSHKFPDGTYYRRNIIDVKLPENPTEEMKRFLQKIKAAGVRALYTVSPLIQLVDMTLDIPKEFRMEWLTITEIYMETVFNGAVFDVRNGGKRLRSGRRVIHGVYNDIIIQPEVIKGYRKFSMSQFYDLSNYQRQVLVNGQSGLTQIHSLERGNLSGLLLPSISYISEPPVDDRLDLQYGIDRYMSKMKKQMFSRLGGFSEALPLSGVYGDHYEDKPTLLIADALTSNPYRIYESSNNIITELIQKVRIRELSGRRQMWEGETTIYSDMGTVTLKIPVILSPYFRLIDLAKSYTETSYHFNTLQELIYTEQVPPTQHTTWISNKDAIMSGNTVMSSKSAYRSGTPGFNYQKFDFTLLFDNPRPEVEVKSSILVTSEGVTETIQEEIYDDFSVSAEMFTKSEITALNVENVIDYQSKVNASNRIASTLEFIQFESSISEQLPEHHKDLYVISCESTVLEDELAKNPDIETKIIGNLMTVYDTSSHQSDYSLSHDTSVVPQSYVTFSDYSLSSGEITEYIRTFEMLSKVYGIADLEPHSGTTSLSDLETVPLDNQSTIQIEITA